MDTAVVAPMDTTVVVVDMAAAVVTAVEVVVEVTGCLTSEQV